MKTTEEIIEQKLADFKAQLLKELSPKTEFEVGKWYKWLGKGCAIVNYQGGLDGFGINDMHGWNTSAWAFQKFSDWRLATESEIKEALVKEWEKQANGAKYIDNGELLGMTSNKNSYPLVDKYLYNLDTDTLYCEVEAGNNYTVYRQGKFAKPIVKEEAIKIGGYEVSVIDKPLGGKTARIDAYSFDKDFWEAAKIISEHSKAGVWVGCDAKRGGRHKWLVDTKTINAILEKLKQ